MTIRIGGSVHIISDQCAAIFKLVERFSREYLGFIRPHYAFPRQKEPFGSPGCTITFPEDTISFIHGFIFLLSSVTNRSNHAATPN